jgi:hypothetical protein
MYYRTFNEVKIWLRIRKTCSVFLESSPVFALNNTLWTSLLFRVMKYDALCNEAYPFFQPNFANQNLNIPKGREAYYQGLYFQS